MVWRPLVLTTDRSMILATRCRSEGLDKKRPITEGTVAMERWEFGAIIAALIVHLLIVFASDQSAITHY